MTMSKSDQPPTPTTMYAFVGNIGCIRFPLPVRKSSGIKRGDRLAVIVQDADTILLEKLDVPNWVPTEAISDVSVDGCACTEPPEACSKSEAGLVKVGWSYVQLDEALAIKLGFLPDSPIKLVAEPAQITVSLHQNLHDLQDVPHLACPP